MPLSQEWRIRKSTVPKVELALGLQALSKVIGSISPESESVRFGGMSMNVQGKTIVIDHKHALTSDKFPIPDNEFDILVGLASHEAAHTATDAVNTGDVHVPTESESFTLRDFIDIAEEVYTDAYVSRHHPVNYRYIQLARLAYSADVSEIDASNIRNVWMAKAVYGLTFGPDDISQDHIPVHALLDSLTGELSNTLIDIDKPWRVKLYREMYPVLVRLLAVEELKKQYSKPEPSKGKLPDDLKDEFEPSNTPINLKGDEPAEDSGNGTDKVASSEDMPDFHLSDSPAQTDEVNQLLDAVQDSLESGSVDLTQEIKELLDDSNIRKDHKDRRQQRHGDSSIIYENSMLDYDDFNPDPVLMRDLDWIKRIKNDIRRQVHRAEPEGILDRHRLYRHKTDGFTYKKILQQREQKLSLVLLLDASSSMQAHRQIYDAAKALFYTIKETVVLAYSDSHHNHDDGIFITNETWDGRFRGILPNGGTPSGQGLLTAAIRYPRSMIIHFTDGDSNVDVTPEDAFAIIRKKFPSVQIANIIMSKRPGMHPQYDMLNQHPNVTAQMIKSVQEFPDALKKALEPWYRSR